MSISYGAAGTAVVGHGTNPTLSPLPPSSTSNSINILMIGWKSSSIPAPTISSSTGLWTRMDIAKNTSVVASGADTGSTSTLIYYSYGVAPTGTTVLFAGSVGAAQAVIFNYTKSSSDSWILAHSIGSDDGYGANYSASSTTDFEAGGASDTLVACTTINSDAGTISSPTITATGCTFGTITERINSQSSDGDDSGLYVSDGAVTAGIQTDVAITGFTNSSSSQGSTLVIRLRVTTSPLLTVTAVDPFYTTAGYDVTVTGLTHFYKFHVYRNDSTGSGHQDVRGGELQLVETNPEYAATDFEFSFGSVGVLAKDNNITYQLDVLDDNAVVLFTSTAIVNPRADWMAAVAADSLSVGAAPKSYLSVPDIPSLNVPVLLQDFTTTVTTGNILSNSHVLGRVNPVVNADVMSGRTGTFVIFITPRMTGIAGGTTSCNNVRDLIDLFKVGQVCMLRTVEPSVCGESDVFFTVNTATPERQSKVADMALSFDNYDQVDQVWFVSVEFIEQDRPDNTSAVSSFGWQDVLDGNASWQSVLSGNVDWLQVLQTGV